MMKAILLIVLLILPTKVIAPTDRSIVIIDRGGMDPLEMLWRAVCIVESNNDPLAVNVKERAYGIAQIRKCRMEHYVSLTGKNYKHEDAFDPAISKEIFYYFARGKSYEVASRNWNGKWELTEGYWKRVKANL